ncbi:nucleotidyltransferase domain-containing protein [Novosphingobium sp. 1949]|uniref:Nucleotidyltransferase domain-containing protein n=1 Tax=Novosphingobium organovorum TaxID=2930092 RepID=A0ABT0BGJ0_9SPHN|nr:nucleotidyltransferase domain-containing protein [Novosphingobium organovorum]MCJ2184191.1 nucleotidyltransferase domain-containing protein [Novosphingobium organovorum]
MNTLRAADVKAEIEGRLLAVEREEGVRLLLCVESGSRAWGFPSPDSDYDVRFVYVRARDAYLGLRAPRDVIERPILDDIDLNGWDLRKLLALMLKSNATVSEWLASPIRYRADDPVMARVAALADRLFEPRGVARHYASLCRNALDRWPEPGAAMGVKRYFYALRPALALRALRRDPTRRPPMDLASLLVRAGLGASLESQIAELVAIKTQTREAGPVARYPELDALIRGELAQAGAIPERPLPGDAEQSAETLLLDCVNT